MKTDDILEIQTDHENFVLIVSRIYMWNKADEWMFQLNSKIKDDIQIVILRGTPCILYFFCFKRSWNVGF